MAPAYRVATGAALPLPAAAPRPLAPRRAVTLCVLLVLLLVGAASAKEVGCRNRWGPYIEGAAVDKDGNLYAIDFERDRGVVGRVNGKDGSCAPAPAAKSQGGGAVKLNGLRVLPGGALLGVSPDSKRVVVIPPGSSSGAAARDFCKLDSKAPAPNDLAVSPSTGYVYISAQEWRQDNAVGDGAVYMCKKAGDAPVRWVRGRRGHGQLQRFSAHVSDVCACVSPCAFFSDKRACVRSCVHTCMPAGVCMLTRPRSPSMQPRTMPFLSNYACSQHTQEYIPRTGLHTRAFTAVEVILHPRSTPHSASPHSRSPPGPLPHALHARQAAEHGANKRH